MTGASGFIGRYALPQLSARGYEVHAVSRSTVALEVHTSSRAHWHQADLIEAEVAAYLIEQIRPTHLLHLGWYAEPGKYWSAPENFRWVEASLRLAQVFAQHGGERIVAAGTCAEYDWTQSECCADGETPLVPSTVYGTCKHAWRMLLESFAEISNLSAAWGRVFFLYGAGERRERFVASVICSLLRGQRAKCSHGEQQRDFLHVNDVARAFVSLLDTDATGAFDIGTGQTVKLKDVVYLIADDIGRRDLVRLGALPAPANEPPMLRADARRLMSATDWQPEYELEQGLRSTIAWWRTQLSL